MREKHPRVNCAPTSPARNRFQKRLFSASSRPARGRATPGRAFPRAPRHPPAEQPSNTRGQKGFPMAERGAPSRHAVLWARTLDLGAAKDDSQAPSPQAPAGRRPEDRLSQPELHVLPRASFSLLVVADHRQPCSLATFAAAYFSPLGDPRPGALRRGADPPIPPLRLVSSSRVTA